MCLEINKRINVTAHVRYTSHSVVAHHGYSFAIDQEFFKVPADVAVTNWGVVQFRWFLEIVSSGRTAALTEYQLTCTDIALKLI